MSENNMSNHSKSRVLSLLALAALVVGGLVFVWRHVENKRDAQASAVVSTAPQINSVPGAGNPSNQYVQDQNLQNQLNEQQARKKGTSAVPTITRSSFVGNPGEFSDDSSNSGSTMPGQCPLKKVVVMFKPNPASCTVENLTMARKTGVTAEELACQGCSCPALKLAGYTSGDLKDVGYTAAQLKNCGFTIDQLVAAGFTARDLKSAGFTAQDLAKAGFTPGEISNAFHGTPLAKNLSEKTGLEASQLKGKGLSAAELKKDGFTAAQLKAAGFSDNDLKAAGFTPKEIAEVSKISKGSEGLSAAELKAHGLTAAQLKKMGFTAAQLKAAGFTADQLKKAGFSAKDLRDAGFSAAALKAAGFNPAELKAAGFTAGQLKAAGFTPEELKAAGFTARDLRAAGVTAAQLHAANFPAAELRAAGFTRGDLLRGGYAPAEAGYAQNTASAGNALQTPASNLTPKVAGSTPGLNNFAAGNNTNSGGASMPSVTGNSPEARLAEIARLQQKQMNAQQRQDYIAQQQGAMTMQAQKLLAGWSNHSTQTLAKAPKVQANNSTGTGSAAGTSATGAPMIKAGTVLFAVLDTAVNSDNNSPIMAHVVSGALKGAKLLGKFGRVNDRVLLSFYLVSDPRYPSSIGINAVAIDPDTAHTAMAGSVDHHYLLRYGTLFASAFLQGMSNAVIANHSTMVCGGLFGTCQQIQTGGLDTAGQAAVAMGTVGQQFSNKLGDTFNTPPTVKVPAGSGLGILFMNDVQMPTQQAAAPEQAAVKNQLLALTQGN